jgi:hypothetical protein
MTHAIIFLDVDGVLNTTNPKEPNTPGYLNPELLRRFCSLVTSKEGKEAGFSIGVVVSSSWRTERNLMSILTKGLLSNGVKAEQILGTTEKFQASYSQLLKPGISISKQLQFRLKLMSKTRCREIEAWLAKPPDRIEAVQSWIAVDDMDLLGGTKRYL